MLFQPPCPFINVHVAVATRGWARSGGGAAAVSHWFEGDAGEMGGSFIDTDVQRWMNWCIHAYIHAYLHICAYIHTYVCVFVYIHMLCMYITFTFSDEIRKIRDEKLFSTERQYSISNCESMAISFNISWLPIQPIFPSLIKMPS